MALLLARTRAGAAADLKLAWDVNGKSCWIFATGAANAGKLEIRDSPGAGMGVFALVDIEPGERMLEEKPLLVWSVEAFDQHLRAGRHYEAMEAAVDLLSPVAQTAFRDLCMNEEHGPRKHAYGIWLSNAYPTEDAPESAAVFRVASRLNHSCAPCAHAHYNLRSHRMTLHGLIRIRAGEEVTVAYMGGVFDVREARRRELKRDFGFICCCALCSLRDEALAASEARQVRIRNLGERITDTPCPPEVVALCEEKLELIEAEQGFLGANWDTMVCAMKYLQATGEPTRARAWAKRAAENARRSLGEDNQEYQALEAALQHAARA